MIYTILPEIIILIVMYFVFTVAVKKMFHVTWKKAFRDMALVVLIAVVLGVAITFIRFGGA